MTSKRLVFLLLLALAIGSLACMTGPEEDFNAGMKAFAKHDYAAAMKTWKALAKQGNASAQTNVGVMYYQGLGVRRDYAEAFKWYEMAAMQGYAEGEYNVGVAFAQGHGTRQDYREAQRWYELAAKQGYAPAQLLLAEMYYRGEGIGVDYDKAAKWYRQAADQGDASAAYILGMMYLTGKLGKDPVKAYLWLTVAASEGKAVARQNALKGRKLVASQMTRAQIAQAQELVKNWQARMGSK